MLGNYDICSVCGDRGFYDKVDDEYICDCCTDEKYED
jgi:hypothetical protein